MAFKNKETYCNGIVICHGKSEWQMVRYISSNLHLGIKAYARDKGRQSIQITSLMNVLKSKPFEKQSSLVSKYPVEEKGKGRSKKLVNFKLFIIMDTDDCTPQQKRNYMSKKMFEGLWLYEYIVPIANSPCLENVLVEAGIMSKKIHDADKGKYYTDVFPINEKPLSDDTLNEVMTLKTNIKKSKNTNMLDFIDYCLSLLPD